jgi:8-oxo-dGTP diphosphatase
VIAQKDGSVAAVRGRRGWFLPGGESLPDESPEETVAREVLEELGRDVNVLGGIGEGIQYFYSSDDSCWYRMTAVFFAGELLGAERPHEASWAWTDPRANAPQFFPPCHVWAISTAGGSGKPGPYADNS